MNSDCKLLRDRVKNEHLYNRVRKIYEDSFPPIERVDFDIFIKLSDEGRAELLAYSLEGEVIGFTFVVFPRNYAYLIFMAVDERYRNKGIGSEMVRGLLEEYSSKQPVVDVEELENGFGDKEYRLKRYKFYSKLGFKDTGYEMHDATGIFRVISTQELTDIEGFKEGWKILPEAYVGTVLIQKEKYGNIE